MPLHQPHPAHQSSKIFSRMADAVLFCLAAASASAQPASSACEPGQDWRSNLSCLSEKTGFIDIALQDSLRQLGEKLPPALNKQLLTQQRDWEQRRDTDCTPKDRPASDSNALAYAALCRSKMALQRTELLQSVLAEPEFSAERSTQDCPKGQELSIPCLQNHRATVETGMTNIYRSLLIRLPEIQAQKLYADQERWQEQRKQSCQLNGYVNEQADQIICRFVEALERIKVYREVWSPIARQKEQP